jgi:hypothetical protein
MKFQEWNKMLIELDIILVSAYVAIQARQPQLYPQQVPQALK